MLKYRIKKNYLLPTYIIVSLDPCLPSSIFWRRWRFRAGFWYIISLRWRFVSTRAWTDPIPGKRTLLIVTPRYSFKYSPNWSNWFSIKLIFWSENMKTEKCWNIPPWHWGVVNSKTHFLSNSPRIFSMTLLLCASSSDVERDLTSSSESPCRRLVIFTSGYFCLGGGGGRVRCFCVGISEGSCINPFWEVGGPRLFSPKFRKYPNPPPPIKNVPSLNSYLLFDSSVFSHWYFILPLRDTRLTILTSKELIYNLLIYNFTFFIIQSQVGAIPVFSR